MFTEISLAQREGSKFGEEVGPSQRQKEEETETTQLLILIELQGMQEDYSHQPGSTLSPGCSSGGMVLSAAWIQWAVKLSSWDLFLGKEAMTKSWKEDTLFHPMVATLVSHEGKITQGRPGI